MCQRLYLNIKKAFDTVCDDILIFTKQTEKRCDQGALKLFVERKCVRVNNEFRKLGEI